MTMNTELLYWRENKEWYTYDKTQKNNYRLSDTAPERAKKSYEMWIKYQTRKPTV